MWVGGGTEAAGVKTLQASFWTPVKPAPPHLSFYRESWGCSHCGNTSAEKWVGVPPQQRARPGSHHLATASPPSWHHQPGGEFQGVRTRLLRSWERREEVWV